MHSKTVGKDEVLKATAEANHRRVPDLQSCGVLPVSWNGWGEVHSADSVVLCLEGSAAPEGSPQKNSGAALIAEYRSRGPRFVESLRGSFAMALWDARAQKLFLATDHFGTRRVYYWNRANRIAFAPRIKNLLETSEIEQAIDPNSVYFYLNHSFISAPFTIFKDVRRMEPGHLLEWSRGQLVLCKYWDMEYPENQALSEEQAASSIRDSLRESVHFAARRCRGGRLDWRFSERRHG